MIHLSGYFNALNIGDDAICKVITDNFGCVIPKNLSEPAKATIVGGGEYDSWMIEGVANDLYATGIGLVRDMIGKQRQAELKRFKQLWVRTHMDYRVAKMYGLNPLQGIDSAVLMDSTEEGFKDKVILIPTVHIKDKAEYPEYDIALPLNPHDDVEGSVKLFNKPQEYLNALVGAKKIITYGRLHAHILGFVAGTEVEDIMIEHSTVFPRWEITRKSYIAKVLGWLEMKERYSLKEMRKTALNMINNVKEEIQ